MKRISAFALLLALAITAGAQDKPAPQCTRVRIVHYNWDDSSQFVPGRLTMNQLEWWTKHGQKKFKNLCLVQDAKDADYILAWAQTTTSFTAIVPQVTNHQGTITADGQTTTYSGTSTTSTVRELERWYVILNVFKVTPDKQPSPPVFTTNHMGRWIWSKPDKDAFTKGLQFISKRK